MLGAHGDGRPAASAHLNAPGQIAIDADGDIFIVDVDNFAVRAAHAPSLLYPQSMAVDPAGNLYIADAFNKAIRVVKAADSATVSGVLR